MQMIHVDTNITFLRWRRRKTKGETRKLRKEIKFAFIIVDTYTFHKNKDSPIWIYTHIHILHSKEFRLFLPYNFAFHFVLMMELRRFKYILTTSFIWCPYVASFVYRYTINPFKWFPPNLLIKNSVKLNVSS